VTARVLFGFALVLAGWTVMKRRSERMTAAPAGPPAPLAIAWDRELFAEWKSEEDGITVLHPERFDTVRGFGRFTSRKVADGIEEVDVAAFRSMAPRAVITLATYRAEKARTWEQWVALAKQDLGAPPPSDPKTPSPFSAEFGGSDGEYRIVPQGEREALAVSARGAVRYPARGNETMELWHFESRLVAEGDRAVRVTAGVHQAHWEQARPGMDRVLASFRWIPPYSKRGVRSEE
jgi:hypothetical protein